MGIICNPCMYWKDNGGKRNDSKSNCLGLLRHDFVCFKISPPSQRHTARVSLLPPKMTACLGAQPPHTTPCFILLRFYLPPPLPPALSSKILASSPDWNRDVTMSHPPATHTTRVIG